MALLQDSRVEESEEERRDWEGGESGEGRVGEKRVERGDDSGRAVGGERNGKVGENS